MSNQFLAGILSLSLLLPSQMAPQTGDAFNAGLWASCMLLSICLAIKMAKKRVQ